MEQLAEVVPIRPDIVPQQPRRELSFVSANGHWDVTPTGDRLTDCAKGERLAVEWLRHLQACSKSDSECLSLGWHARAIPGTYSDVEKAFWVVITTACLAGADHAQRFVERWS